MNSHSEFAERSSPQIESLSQIVYEKNFSQLTSPVAIAIFLASVAFFIGFIYLLIIGSDNFGLYFILLLLSIPGFFFGFVRQYGPTEKAVIYRFGNFCRTIGPGWAILLPFIENEYAIVDTRVHQQTKYKVIAYTKDDVPIEFDFAYYVRVVDASKAVMNVNNIERAISTYIFGNVRGVVGKILMREMFSDMDSLENLLKPELEKHSLRWGFDVENVEILHISLPKTVFQALSEPITQEQKAIAARFEAEAKRVIINVVGDSAKNLSPQALTYIYIQALNKLGQQAGSKIVIPTDYSSMMNLATNASLAAEAIGGKANLKKIISDVADNIKG